MTHFAFQNFTMDFKDMWRVLSLWLVPWVLLHNLSGRRLPSPFPLAVLATVFTAVYAPCVLDKGAPSSAWMTGWHLAIAAWCKVDVSTTAIGWSLTVALVHSALLIANGSSPVRVYAQEIPVLHRRHDAPLLHLVRGLFFRNVV